MRLSSQPKPLSPSSLSLSPSLSLSLSLSLAHSLPLTLTHTAIHSGDFSPEIYRGESVNDGKRMRRRDWRSCRTRTRTASRTYSAAKAPKSCRESRRSARRTSIPDRVSMNRLPSSSRTRGTLCLASITSLGFGLSPSTPPPEKNLLHGFSRYGTLNYPT